MTQGPFAELRRIVEHALDLPEAERDAWIARACGSDEGLLAEVRAVLEASTDGETFLASSPLERAPEDPIAPGTRIGSYAIVRRIGVGGMGTVFEAEQDVPRRRVALKLMQAGLLGPSALERFRYEIEVLGALRHPGIAQIHAAGLERLEGGLGEIPWFAMEFIEGAATLTAYASREALGLRARIGLFLDVCDAVQHGHEHGVIHRDLKPDNLLVDAHGQTKVIDFGVARVADPEALAATLRTQADEIVGTLAYMSPEQVAGGEVETRSDVYALGVVLYQLVTNELPIEVHKSDFLTSARRIQEAPPRRPRAFVPDIRVDLEAIILRCLDKDPQRRYGSAGGLAEDLRRHLAGEAVEARPPTTFHQLRLLARRNKVLVGASLAVFVVAIAGAIVSLQFAFASNRSEQQAHDRAEEASRAEAQAQVEAVAAQRERDRFQALFRNQFAQNVDTVSLNTPDLVEVPGGAALAERMLAETIERLQELHHIAADDPEVVFEIARAYLRLAVAQGSEANPAMDVRRMGAEAIERSLALTDQLIERDPGNVRYRAHRAGTIAFLAEAALWTEAREEVGPRIQQAREILAGLPADQVPFETAAFVDEVAARWAYFKGKVPLAHACVTRSLAARRRALALRPDSERSVDRHAFELRLRGDIELQLAKLEKSRAGRNKQFAAARASFREAAAVSAPIAKAHPERISYRCSMLLSVLREAEAVKALALPEDLPEVYARAEALDTVLMKEAPLHLSVRINHIAVLLGRASLETTRTLRAHPKGSKQRALGLTRALRLIEEGLALYVQIDAEGRLRDADRFQWERMKGAARFYRGLVGTGTEAKPSGAGNPHGAGHAAGKEKAGG